MKRAALFLFTLSLLAACSKDDDKQKVPTSETTYQLIEILADPGDGSGTFQPVASSKSIVLKNNGTISSNGQICDMSTSSSSPTSGTYSLQDSTINTPDCSDLPFEISGNLLIISYPCIEPCRAKFKEI